MGDVVCRLLWVQIGIPPGQPVMSSPWSSRLNLLRERLGGTQVTESSSDLPGAADVSARALWVVTER